MNERPTTPIGARGRLRRLAPALAALAGALVLVPAVGGPATAAVVGDCNADAAWPASRADYADEVVRLVNQHRATLNLVPLKVSSTLTAAAVWKARHMAHYSYMQHDDPAPPVERRWYDRVDTCGYTGSGKGENIAFGYPTPQAVMTGWLESPGHRANIENASFRVIGVGAAGASMIYWAQNFGSTDDSGSAPPPPPTDTTPPTVPTSLAATAQSSTLVGLGWSASTDNVGVAGYRVYRNGILLGSTPSTAYFDASAAANTTYSYTVRAYDAAGNVSGPSTAATVTTPGDPESPADTTPPSVPTGLTGLAQSSNAVALRWDPSIDDVGVAGYRVYRNGSWIAATTSTSYVDYSAEPNTTYSYTVRAYDAAGNTSGSSTPVWVATPDDSEAPPPTATTTTFPWTVRVAIGSLRAGNASALAAEDGETLDVDVSPWYQTASWYARLPSTNALTSLSVRYVGSSSLACRQSVYLYNWSNGYWISLGSRSVGPEPTEFAVTVSGSLANYVSGLTGAGDVAVRVHCTRDDWDPFFLRGDLLTITYGHQLREIVSP